MDSKSISYLIYLIIEIVMLVIYVICTAKEIKCGNSSAEFLKYRIFQFFLYALLPTAIILVLSITIYDFIPEVAVFIYALYWIEKYSISKKNDPPDSLTVVPELRQYYEALKNVLSPFSNCELTYRIFNSAKCVLRSHLDPYYLNPSDYMAGGSEMRDISYHQDVRNKIFYEKCETWAVCFSLFILESDIRPMFEKGTALTLYLQNRAQELAYRTPTSFLYGFRASETIKKLYQERLEKEKQ